MVTASVHPCPAPPHLPAMETAHAAIVVNEVQNSSLDALAMIGEQKLQVPTNDNDQESSRASTLSNTEKQEIAECRICQEEDQTTNLESPCACSGSLKFAHRKCVQHWCNEKGDIICEICRKPFESGYTALSHPVQDSVSINVGRRSDVQEPRLFTLSADHQFLDDDYAGANARNAACFRSVALILMAVLLLRHLLLMAASDSNDDASTLLMLFVLRAVGFLLPFYIIARAFSALQYRHPQEESGLHAPEITYLIQAGHARGMQIAVSPGISA